METAHPIDWAALAHTLGYADQAHLTRDFPRMFSEPPTTSDSSGHEHTRRVLAAHLGPVPAP